MSCFGHRILESVICYLTSIYNFLLEILATIAISDFSKNIYVSVGLFYNCRKISKKKMKDQFTYYSQAGKLKARALDFFFFYYFN